MKAYNKLYFYQNEQLYKNLELVIRGEKIIHGSKYFEYINQQAHKPKHINQSDRNGII